MLEKSLPIGFLINMLPQPYFSDRIWFCDPIFTQRQNCCQHLPEIRQNERNQHFIVPLAPFSMLHAQFSYGKHWQRYISQHWKWGRGEINFKGGLCGIEYVIVISTKNWLCKKCWQQVLSLSVWIAISTTTALFFVRISSIVITDFSGNKWIELNHWFIHKGWKHVCNTRRKWCHCNIFHRFSHIWRISHQKR